MIYCNVEGRLGADSEIKTAKSGNQYVSMRVASNDYVNGETVTTWIGVAWYGERALRMQQYMKKGSHISVWGTMRTSLYDNRNGEKAIATDIMADRVDFIGSKTSASTTSNETTPTDTGTFMQPSAAQSIPTIDTNATTEADDDLPF